MLGEANTFVTPENPQQSLDSAEGTPTQADEASLPSPVANVPPIRRGRKPKAVQTQDSPPVLYESGKRRFAVKLDINPQLVVEADNAAEAWEVYRKEMSIVASDHQPDIREVGG